MQVRNLDSLKHFIKHVMSNTLKLQNLGGGGGKQSYPKPTHKKHFITPKKNDIIISKQEKIIRFKPNQHMGKHNNII